MDGTRLGILALAMISFLAAPAVADEEQQADPPVVDEDAQEAGEAEEEEEAAADDSERLVFEGPAGDVYSLTYQEWVREVDRICNHVPAGVDPEALGLWCASMYGWTIPPDRMPPQGIAEPPSPSEAASSAGSGLRASSSYRAPMDPGIADEAAQRMRHASTPGASRSAAAVSRDAAAAPAPPPPSRSRSKKKSR